MNYSATYTYEDGHTKEVSITEDDSRVALRNDYQEIVRRYNPKFVTIQRVHAGPGEALHLEVTVKAPSHYLSAGDDITPKACESMTVNIIAYPGYPLTPVKAYYASDHFLASPNVFRSGSSCIDAWIPFTSSLITVVEKLLRDMIHDPSVTRYDSMANSRMEQWHKSGVTEKRFPTIQPKLLYAPEVKPLPPRKTATAPPTTPPPLPSRCY